MPKTDEDTSQRLITRIKALLELGKSPNPHEAASAVAKAQALLQRHNLDLAQLYEEKPGQYVQQRISIGSRSAVYRQLLHILAEASFCKSFGIQTTQDAYLVGEPENIQAVTYLYHYLKRELERMAHDDFACSRSDLRRNVWTTTYLLGAAKIIEARLQAQTRAFAEEGAETRALVLRKSEHLGEAVNFFLKGQGKTTQSRVRVSGDLQAYTAGARAGQRVHLPVRGGEQPALPNA